MATFNGTSLPTNQELMHSYYSVLKHNISNGVYRPIILPYDGFGVALLVTYLCIPHSKRPWLYACRWPVAGLIVAFYVDMLRSTRSSFMGSGFGVGLIAAWLLVWSVTWLVFEDPQAEAKRVERRKEWSVNKVEQEGNAIASGIKMNGEANGSVKHRQQNGSSTVRKDTYSEFFWQPYPLDSIWARFDWVSDLVYNFRGPGWNWEIRSNPGLPTHILASLGETSTAKTVSNTGIRRYKTRSELARHIIPRMLCNYLILDCLKVLLMTDGYFLLGPPGVAFPVPTYLTPFPIWLHRFARQLLSCVAIITALETIFPLAPLVFCLFLGPRVFGLRGEAWMYPSTWGGLSIIGEKGLNGLWSGWWHQTFRFAFISPTQYLIKKGILAPRGKSTKMVGLVVAFALSGFFHASGSFTQIASTYPWQPMVFFLLQALGIFVQTTVCAALRKQINSLPKIVRQAGNFVYTCVWMYTTSPWLIDDFARGGIWLFEPVPISPLRALGFGKPGDSWWCWDFSGVGWYHCDKWWMNGLAF